MAAREPVKHAAASTTAATLAAAKAMHDVIERVSHEGAAHGMWDLRVEGVSLGGLLVLRQEIELLAELAGAQTIVLHIIGAELNSSQRTLVERTWESSYSVELRFEEYERPGHAWPSDAIGRAGFSYQFFDRVSLLTSALGRLPPRLAWSSRVMKQAQDFRRRFTGRLVVTHLKNIANLSSKESNADQEAWTRFLSGAASSGKLDFVLLGSDTVQSSVTSLPGVARAESLDVPLSVQLALVACADGFIGMASGICAAAVLSATPYVLFKHPSHHVEEMQRELGSGEQFPFAGRHQKVWRRADNTDCLMQALREISSEWTS